MVISLTLFCVLADSNRAKIVAQICFIFFINELANEVAEKSKHGITLSSGGSSTSLEGEMDCRERINNKIFCGLEKRNYVIKQMIKLTLNNGEEICESKNIIKEVRTFYERLYSDRQLEECEIKTWLQICLH